jgi:hypothetical protein
LVGTVGVSEEHPAGNHVHEVVDLELAGMSDEHRLVTHERIEGSGVDRLGHHPRVLLGDPPLHHGRGECRHVAHSLRQPHGGARDLAGGTGVMRQPRSGVELSVAHTQVALFEFHDGREHRHIQLRLRAYERARIFAHERRHRVDHRNGHLHLRIAPAGKGAVAPSGSPRSTWARGYTRSITDANTSTTFSKETTNEIVSTDTCGPLDIRCIPAHFLAPPIGTWRTLQH